MLWGLLLTAALGYLAFLPLREMRASDEAIFAQIALDMCQNGNWLSPQLFGQPCPNPPLYPWLTALFLLMKLPAEIAVRLPATLAVFGTAAMAAWVARRHKDSLAGLIAAAVVLTAYAPMQVGIFGQRETLHGLLLCAAWFIWHEEGLMARRWNLAWSCALGLILLDTLNVGLRSVIIFYLPLLLTRTPRRPWRFLATPVHLGWLISYALIFYLWHQIAYNQPFFAWDTIIAAPEPQASVGYFKNLFLFPTKVFVKMLPWGLLIWTPFCLALQPLEPKGTLCGFLRAVVLCPFLAYLFLPFLGTSPLMLLAQLAPLAVLIAMTAQIVFHRNERFFRRVATAMLITAIAGLTLLALLTILGACGKILFTINDTPLPVASPRAYAAIALFALAMATTAFMALRRKPSEIALLLWGALTLRILILLATEAPHTILYASDRRSVAQDLTEKLPKEATPKFIYILSETCYPAVGHYLQTPVKQIYSMENSLLDQDNSPVVYLLATRQPISHQRIWTPISDPVDLGRRRSTTKLEVRRLPIQVKLENASSTPALFRLYQGKLEQK